MAISNPFLCGSATGNAVTSLAATLATAGISVGQIAIAIINTLSTSSSFTVTDSSTGGPNTWNVLTPAAGSLSTVVIAWANITHALGTSDTVTFSWTTSATRAVVVVFGCALGGSGTLDGQSQNVGTTTTTATPGSFTTTKASELGVVAYGWDLSIDAVSYSDDYTNLGGTFGALSTDRLRFCYSVLSSVGAQNPSETANGATASDWASASAFIFPPQAGGGHQLALTGVGT